MLPEPTPERRLTHQAVGVHGVAGEAGRRAPGRGLVVQGRGDGAELLEAMAGKTAVVRGLVENLEETLALGPAGDAHMARFAELGDRRGDEIPPVASGEANGHAHAGLCEGAGPEALGFATSSREL